MRLMYEPGQADDAEEAADAGGDDHAHAAPATASDELPAGYERPVMVHRAILGSVERMFAVLLEHTGGKWCVPLFFCCGCRCIVIHSFIHESAVVAILLLTGPSGCRLVRLRLCLCHKRICRTVVKCVIVCTPLASKCSWMLPPRP